MQQIMVKPRPEPTRSMLSAQWWCKGGDVNTFISIVSYHITGPLTQEELLTSYFITMTIPMNVKCFIVRLLGQNQNVQVNHVGILLKYRFWLRKIRESQNIFDEFKNKIK